MFPWDNEKMNRGMGTDILKNNQRLILIQEIGWLFSFYDFTENTFFFHRTGRPARTGPVFNRLSLIWRRRYVKPSTPRPKDRACLRPEFRSRGSGLTLSGTYLARLKRRGLAPPNGSIKDSIIIQGWNEIPKKCEALAVVCSATIERLKPLSLATSSRDTSTSLGLASLP